MTAASQVLSKLSRWLRGGARDAAARSVHRPARAVHGAGLVAAQAVRRVDAGAVVQLDQAWHRGFSEGYRDLMNADGTPPARPADAIPSEVDPLEYWHLMGYQAGFRAAADKLGI